MSSQALVGKRIVITGVTGQVARPLALRLAADNEVFGAARFEDAAARDALEHGGVHCVPIDLLAGDVGGLPADADYVLHFAVAKIEQLGDRPARQQRGTGLPDGAPPRRHRLLALLDHRGLQARGPPRLRRGRAVGRQPRRLALLAHLQHLQDRGRGHGQMGGGALRPAHHHRPPVGSLRRRRGMARHPSAHDAVGQAVPVHVDAPSVYHPLHADDIFAMVPGLLDVAIGARPPRSTGAAARR